MRSQHRICQNAENRLKSRFKNIKNRCYNQRHRSYKDYGGRGIFVCDEWLENPQRFVEWSMSHGFRDDLQLDRIDNDGPYSPDNCRWVTAFQNSRNRRNTIRILIDGVEMCAKDACAVIGIDYQSFYERVERGWDVVRALIVPVGFRRPHICFNKGAHGNCHVDGRKNRKCPFGSDGAMRMCSRFTEVRSRFDVSNAACSWIFALCVLTQAAMVSPNREPNAVANAAGESSVSCANTWNTYQCAQSGETFGRTNGGYAQCWCAPVKHNDLLKPANPRTATDGRTVQFFKRRFA